MKLNTDIKCYVAVIAIIFVCLLSIGVTLSAFSVCKKEKIVTQNTIYVTSEELKNFKLEVLKEQKIFWVWQKQWREVETATEQKKRLKEIDQNLLRLTVEIQRVEKEKVR